MKKEHNPHGPAARPGRLQLELIKSWKDYIESKFQPKEEFSFDIEKNSNTLTIRHQDTETYFVFFWPNEGWTFVSDIQFHNNKTEGWSGEYNREANFNNEEIKHLDRFLEPAFILLDKIILSC